MGELAHEGRTKLERDLEEQIRREIVAVSMVTVLYAVSLEEEEALSRMCGEEYEKYKKEVGMIFPKLKRGSEK